MQTIPVFVFVGNRLEAATTSVGQGIIVSLQ
jgi:hypothetical protein